MIERSARPFKINTDLDTRVARVVKCCERRSGATSAWSQVQNEFQREWSQYRTPRRCTVWRLWSWTASDSSATSSTYSTAPGWRFSTPTRTSCWVSRPVPSVNP